MRYCERQRKKITAIILPEIVIMRWLHNGSFEEVERDHLVSSLPSGRLDKNKTPYEFAK